jgi:hypothetical protein
MENLNQEIKSIQGVRRLIDVVGILAGVTSLVFPSVYGILFHPTESFVTPTIILTVTFTLLPAAINYMVLSIALRFRSRDLKKIVATGSEELLASYLVKIAKHRTVLLTIGWVLTARTIYEVLGPAFNILRLDSLDPAYAENILPAMLVGMVGVAVQGAFFAAAQFGLARFLKNQGQRLTELKPEIPAN